MCIEPTHVEILVESSADKHSYKIVDKPIIIIMHIFTTEPCLLGNKQGLYSISYFLWGKTFDMKISYFPQGATSANHSRGLA